MRYAVIFASLFATPAFAEQSLSPLEAARALSIEGPIYAYEMEYNTGEITARGTVDPTKPVGSRIVVTEPAKDGWPADFEKGLKKLDAEVDGDIWCASFLDTVPENAELINETKGVARYGFQPQPEDPEDAKFMKHLRGTVDIDTEDNSVLGFVLSADKSFKPNMMVKIENFNMTAECSRVPDGRTYARSVSTSVTGSAMTRKFDEKQFRLITALYPAQE